MYMCIYIHKYVPIHTYVFTNLAPILHVIFVSALYRNILHKSLGVSDKSLADALICGNVSKEGTLFLERMIKYHLL